MSPPQISLPATDPPTHPALQLHFPAPLHHDVEGVRPRPLFPLFTQGLWGVVPALVPTASQ